MLLSSLLLLVAAWSVAASAQPQQPTKTAPEYVKAGDAMVAAGDVAGALDQYSQAIKLNPADYLAYMKRTTAYLRQNRHKSALLDLNKVIQLKPDFLPAYNYRGKILLQQGRFAEANADYHYTLKAKPADAETQEKLANVELALQKEREGVGFFRANQMQRAVEVLNEVLEIAPNSVELRTYRMKANMALQQYGEVGAEALQIVRLDPKNTDAAVLGAKAQYILEDFDAATSTLRAALEQDPEHVEAKKMYKILRSLVKNVNGAVEASAQNNYADALEYYDKAAATDADNRAYNAYLHLQRCKVLLKLRKPDAAVVACTKALEERRDDADAYATRAEAHAMADRYADAVRDYEQATQRSQQDQNLQNKLHHARKMLKQVNRVDYYKILEVPKTATQKEIKAAYHHKARTEHPDKHRETDESREAAEIKFRLINEAYEILSDEEKRRRYDGGEDIQDIETQNQGQGHNPFPGFPGGFTFNFGGGR